MNFERPCELPPETALARVVRWFEANGYSVASRSGREMHLLGSLGGGRHRLSLRADGRCLRFEFAPASQLERLPPSEELERRVDAAALEAGLGPRAGAGSRRCPDCATAAQPGETHCGLCGAPL